MTEYHWSISSALFQLRWEPSERRASAVDYLTSVINSDGSAFGQATREVAAGLLALYSDTAPEAQEVADSPVAHRELPPLAALNLYGDGYDTAEPENPENLDIRNASLTCSVCDGPLEVSAQEPQAGYLHANDADDTHVPEYRAENTSDPNHRLYVRPENRIA